MNSFASSREKVGNVPVMTNVYALKAHLTALLFTFAVAHPCGHTPAAFNFLITCLIDRTREPLRNGFGNAGTNARDLLQVICAGFGERIQIGEVTRQVTRAHFSRAANPKRRDQARQRT